MKRQKLIFDIDVTGACNLHCPSCPQGNSKINRQPSGLMDPELLKKIVTKASAECMVKGINLFNWGEPLLHPEIHRLVYIVQDAGIPCHLSSNLNILPDADALMTANPASFKISVSGFTQEIYGITHRSGDIGRVKRHMVGLAEAKKRNNATTRIFVTYHRYRHNLKEETLMRDFAVGLGFDFDPVWALMFPLEKILSCVDDVTCAPPLTDEDHQLIGRLAFPLKEALEAAQKHHIQPCCLRDSQLSLDFQGNVMLCCGVFDAGTFTLGNYLEMPLDGIQAIRKSHSLCKRCMRNGAHAFLTYRVPEMEELILETISAEDIEHLDLRHEIAQGRRQQRLQRIYMTYFSQMIGDRQKEILKTLLHQILGFAQVTNRLLSGKK